MTLGKVKQLLFETVSSYHPGAMVVWEKTKGVTPKPPYITLGYGNLDRSLFTLNDDEGEHHYYNYSFRFEINLYTVGKKVEVDGATYYENTAVEDLEEFVRYLDSENVTNQLADKNVAIVLNPPIRDLSELIGDVKFNYRSMAEFTVTFIGTADGSYGVYGTKNIPNPSGGGLEKFAEGETFPIENVEIQEDTDND